jgi:hypothetical protein
MAVNETWTDPDSLDRSTGDVLTEVIYDQLVSNTAFLGSQTGTGHVAGKRIGIPVHNATGGSLAAGSLVYINGYNAGATSPTVAKADADANAAEFILSAAIANGAAGVAFRGYELGSLNTSGSSVGDPIYLSATAGSWSASALTGAAQLSQRVGVVATSHASTGTIQFDLPGEVLKIGSGQLQSGAVASGGKIQAVATLGAKTGAQTSTSTSYIDVSSMTATLTTTKGGLLVWASCSADCDAASEELYLALQLDSATEVGVVSATLGAGSTNQNNVLSTVYAWTSVSDASHTVDARAKKAGHTGGTWRIDTGTLLMMEFDD